MSSTLSAVSLLKKFAITAALFGCTVLVVAFAGQSMIEQSTVFDEATAELRNKYAVNTGPLRIPLLSSFQFSESQNVGHASFVLCTEHDCYRITAKKEAGKWRVASAKS